jgi:hypothetical protein
MFNNKIIAGPDVLLDGFKQISSRALKNTIAEELHAGKTVLAVYMSCKKLYGSYYRENVTFEVFYEYFKHLVKGNYFSYNNIAEFSQHMINEDELKSHTQILDPKRSRRSSENGQAAPAVTIKFEGRLIDIEKRIQTLKSNLEILQYYKTSKYLNPFKEIFTIDELMFIYEKSITVDEAYYQKNRSA